MEKVTVDLGQRSYEIIIDSGILSGIGERLKSFEFSPKVGVVSNLKVFRLYGEQVMRSLSRAGFKPFRVLIPDGEKYKNLRQLEHILSEFLKQRLDRNACIVALGGGVIGDIAGFAASVYMRGVNFVQIPTTLLAQVDSSVGGKTGVNHPLGKNMIGTFYQPRLVWVDTDTLKTLQHRQLLCGIAEVIKYGVIWDEKFFEFLERNKDALLGLDTTVLTRVIKTSCAIKAAVVSKDEREAGLRAILNYGHTIGHAIETETGYRRFLHGEAVAIGMHLAARLAQALRLLDKTSVERIKALIDACGLPSGLPPDMEGERLLAHMMLDKKALAGKVTFVLPERIGKVRVRPDVSPDLITKIVRGGS